MVKVNLTPKKQVLIVKEAFCWNWCAPRAVVGVVPTTEPQHLLKTAITLKITLHYVYPNTYEFLLNF